jgi:hypothetical protein
MIIICVIHVYIRIFIIEYKNQMDLLIVNNNNIYTIALYYL